MSNLIKNKHHIASLLCILICMVSWITNLGWIRFLFAIPMAMHAVAFFLANHYYSRIGNTSITMRRVNYIVYATYLLAYIFLPDGGDAPGSLRTFFGLISNEHLIEISSAISSAALTCHVVLLIIQTVHVNRTIKLARKNSFEPANETDTTDTPRNKAVKPWLRIGRMWLMIVISTIVLFPYILWGKNALFSDHRERQRYRDFPHVATITISNLDTLTQEDRNTARELINARTNWIHNQKRDWDAHGRRRSFTFDLSQSDRIRVIFGYEKDFDIHAFVDAIVYPADLRFIDADGNPVISIDEILSARDVYHGATQSSDVILTMTEAGKQQFLASVDRMGEDKRVTIVFDGSIPSDFFTMEESDDETLVIKGFINDTAAQALIKLMEIKTAPGNLQVALRVD